jgi:hypothetical protein
VQKPTSKSNLRLVGISGGMFGNKSEACEVWPHSLEHGAKAACSASHKLLSGLQTSGPAFARDVQETSDTLAEKALQSLDDLENMVDDVTRWSFSRNNSTQVLEPERSLEISQISNVWRSIHIHLRSESRLLCIVIDLTFALK